MPAWFLVELSSRHVPDGSYPSSRLTVAVEENNLVAKISYYDTLTVKILSEKSFDDLYLAEDLYPAENLFPGYNTNYPFMEVVVDQESFLTVNVNEEPDKVVKILEDGFLTVKVDE